MRVGVREDNVGALPAELEPDGCEVRSGGVGDLAARLDRAGERNRVDTGVGDECRARDLAAPREDVDDTRWDAGFQDKLAEAKGGKWRLLCWLEATVHPAARAGASFQAHRISGKFHAITAATTPTGSLRPRQSMSG